MSTTLSTMVNFLTLIVQKGENERQAKEPHCAAGATDFRPTATDRRTALPSWLDQEWRMPRYEPRTSPGFYFFVSQMTTTLRVL